MASNLERRLTRAEGRLPAAPPSPVYDSDPYLLDENELERFILIFEKGAGATPAESAELEALKVKCGWRVINETREAAR